MIRTRNQTQIKREWLWELLEVMVYWPRMKIEEVSVKITLAQYMAKEVLESEEMAHLVSNQVLI